jgi:hypothetical protein
VAINCAICGKDVDPERSAVCESDDGSVVHYQDFVEDLRASFDKISHTVCWAGEHGVERLVEVIEDRNRIERKGFWQIQEKIEALERKLKGQDLLDG